MPALTDDQVLIRAAHRTHCTQDRGRHGKIEARAFLAYIGGREINRDRFARVAEAGVQQGGLDALTALANCGVRHADGYKIPVCAGRIHIHFNIDDVGINALNSRAERTE